MDKIRLLIADDHKLVREGIQAMLSGVEEIEIVGMPRVKRP
jgi:DNA-binding NarL/FixJ family response regulator